MIRVLHVTEDHSFRNTGISSAVDALTRCVPAAIEPAIACVGTETLPVRPGLALQTFSTRFPFSLWGYAPGQRETLARAVETADVVHVHGLWMWLQWAAAHEAVLQSKPLVVSAHGMLEPWIWSRQKWPNRLKKRLYWEKLAYPAFRKAGLIHAVTPREAATLQGYFPGQRLEVVPHGIDLDTIGQVLAGLPPADVAEPPYFLFLGRLNSVKAIDLLIRAFSRLAERKFMLKIAGPIGPREQAHAAALRRLVAALNLEQRVVFTGAVQGAAKWQLYRDAWAFCLPSFSEVLGMVNLEAAAAATPVITSYETGIDEDWARHGGVLVHPQEESIYQGLLQAGAWSPAERRERGLALQKLVQTQYAWARVGQAWADIYGDLAGGGSHAA